MKLTVATTDGECPECKAPFKARLTTIARVPRGRIWRCVTCTGKFEAIKPRKRQGGK